jgi:hypothetical protein
MPASDYDVITVGVFTAGAQKYKHGGLRRLMQLFDSYSVPAAANISSNTADQSNRAGGVPSYDFITTVTEALSKLVDLHETANAACDNVCSAALLGDSAAIMTAKAQLTERVCTITASDLWLM